MKVTYSKNSVFLNILSLPASLYYFVSACFKFAEKIELMGLTSYENKAFLEFTDGFSKTIKKEMEGK